MGLIVLVLGPKEIHILYPLALQANQCFVSKSINHILTTSSPALRERQVSKPPQLFSSISWKRYHAVSAEAAASPIEDPRTRHTREKTLSLPLPLPLLPLSVLYDCRPISRSLCPSVRRSVGGLVGGCKPISFSGERDIFSLSGVGVIGSRRYLLRRRRWAMGMVPLTFIPDRYLLLSSSCS